MSGQHWDEPRHTLDDTETAAELAWGLVLDQETHKDFQTLWMLDRIMVGLEPTYARSKAERVRLGKLRNASKPPYDQDAE